MYSKEGKEVKKDKKIIIIVAIIATLIIAAITVVATLCIINGTKKEEPLNDDFFKTGDNRIVLKLSADDSNAKKMGAIAMYQVYSVDGEQLKSVDMYIEFETDVLAQAANESKDFEEATQTGIYSSHRVEDKYVILHMPDSLFEGVNLSKIREVANEYEESQKE